MKLFSLFLLLNLAEFGFGRNEAKLSRNEFPPGFVFGAGTSAYQYKVLMVMYRSRLKGQQLRMEGLPVSGTHSLMPEDVQLMKMTHLDAYKFSISWSRLIPNGRGPVNLKGLQYYNNLINELISHGIQPHIVLVHYDLPQALEDEYEGWISPKIVKDFKAYAEVCFREFGDRVLYWTTINEPNVLAIGGYDTANFPPARCSYPYGHNCTRGDSTLEPYIAAHNILLAHTAAATIYKKKYQAKQQGFIGLNVFVYWFFPSTNSIEDINATQRAHDFYTGWFVNPLVFGDYPETMRKIAGSKIPAFTKHQSEQIMNSFDFFGINHYSSVSVSDKPNSLKVEERDHEADMFAELVVWRDGAPPGEFPTVPSGLRKTLEYFKQVYGNPPIYIHENGFQARKDTLNDTDRVRYIEGFVGSLLDAVRNGSDARGYFVWSFMDLFELIGGYHNRFGLYHVDFDDKDLKRSPKLSAHWYSEFLKGGDEISIEKTRGPPPTPHFLALGFHDMRSASL
ncbi:beta-glucosidase 22-like isoform X3 [Magnolia sinica]|uniref:beta-glucosidase 22-like isoform X3 n=1 Tax=Magnolia sinica TaxID=86752 RepID=UPI002659E1A2|nr:beta-glucosidase 22-like isoform X3 [Magnolia sinica]